MACTPTPTETLYEVLTTTTSSTSLVDVFTTIPAELSTIFTTFCASSTVDATNTTSTVCLSTGTSDIVTTIHPEEVQTTQSPLVVQIPTTISEPTSTLFSTCPKTSESKPDPPSSSSTRPAVTNSTPDSETLSTTLSEISSTLANGSVSVSTATYTYTVTSAVPSLLGGSDRSNENSVRGNLGPIIGGILGGFLGLIVIALLVWLICRRKHFVLRGLGGRDHTEDSSWLYRARVISPSPSPEPKPYQYGTVGRNVSTPSRDSSPSPAPTRPQSFAFSGLSSTPFPTGFAPSPNVPTFLAPSAYPSSSPSLSPAPNVIQTTRSITPTAPLPPALPEASASVMSVDTAVSYPYPVLPAVLHGSGAGIREPGDGSSVSDRRPTRLSLTLANWNPETDGELFPRGGEDVESVRQRRVLSRGSES